MKEEIKLLRKKAGALPGFGHVWKSDKDTVTDKDGGRDFMKKEELKKVLHLLSLGEKRVNLKGSFEFFFE
jgi:uncharacterized protein (UPF0216 family)